MASFGWKRKHNSITKNKLFSEDGDSDDNHEDIDWLDPCKRLRRSNVISLEDPITKSNRLKKEGATLASSERYWEAIKKWEEAIKLNSIDETLHEMSAQAYLELHELFPAIKSAENCVKINPRWWIGFQTLGRTLLGIGEVKLAIRNFSKAIHLQPDERELWEDDLKWARSLLTQNEKLQNETEKTPKNVDLIELDSERKPEMCKALEKWKPNVSENVKDVNINIKSKKWVRLRY